MRGFRIALTLLLLTPAVLAQTLRVGDAAPPLVVAEWIHGEPVPKLEPGKPYAIAVWSSGCDGCVAHVDTFNHLQERFTDRGLRVLVIANRMEKPATLATTKKFVGDLSTPPRFALAWDVDTRTTAAYTPEKTVSRHPVVLVAPNGKVARACLPTQCEAAFLALDHAAWDPAKAAPVIESFERLDALRNESLGQGEAIERALAEMEALVASSPSVATLLDDLRFELLIKGGELEAAYALAPHLYDAAVAASDAGKLNNLAWVIVDPETKVARRDLDLALRAAVKAVELDKEQSPYSLGTLASVHFARGDPDKAVELQRRVVRMKDAYPEAREELEQYEAAAREAAQKKGK